MVNDLFHPHHLTRGAQPIFPAAGYTLIEWLIVAGLVGVIAAVAIPAYLGYINTTNMTKVNTAYEHAIQATQAELSKDTARTSSRQASTLPMDAAAWIDVFDAGVGNLAPGGGPLYLAELSSPDKKKNSPIDPDITGSVRIRFDSEKQEVQVNRPSYLSLVGFRAKITRETVNVTKTEGG